jgi:preprotein translocase subunit YajC
LFYGREEAVEIDMKKGEEVGLSGGAHGEIIFAGSSLWVANVASGTDEG